MRTLLIKNAHCIATLDADNHEWRDASVFIRGNLIEAIGMATDFPANVKAEADEVIDARGHLVTPGLVNTHHHMYQSLTRAIPAVQNAELFGWLRGLYPIWAGLTPEMVRVSTQVAMAELLLSGCTTSRDHLYIYPKSREGRVRLDDSVEAAQAIGMRFVATRGSMSVGQSQGGLPPDSLVEREDFILQDTQRLIKTWHDSGHGAMTQMAVAPCSPFSVSRDLVRESARLDRAALWARTFACTRTWRKTTTMSLIRVKSSIARPPNTRKNSAGWAPMCSTRIASSSTTKASVFLLQRAPAWRIAHAALSSLAHPPQTSEQSAPARRQ